MIPEATEYIASIDRRFTLICSVLDSLPPEQLNAKPSLASANSIWVLAHHTLGNACAWVLGIATGQPVERDRSGEFASAGNGPVAFRAGVQRFSHEMANAMSRMTVADLDRRLVPPKALWGASEPYEISVRRALLNVVEHASLHLGHLELTRDLQLASG